MSAPVLTGNVDETYNIALWDHSPAPRLPSDALPTHDEHRVVLIPPFTSAVGPTVLHVINAKLNLLRGLQDGWLGDGSIGPKAAAIEDFREFLCELGEDVAIRAEPVGNADGGVEIEWKASGAMRVIEFTGGALWLFENRGDVYQEETVTPFDPKRAVGFFRGEPL